MKWSYNDMEMYVQAKEYVDTFLVPFVPFSFSRNDEDTKRLALHAELMDIFVNEIEKQYKGRIVLAPSYSYLLDGDYNEEIPKLNGYVEHAKDNGFKHILFLTFDKKWKKRDSKLHGNLIWVSAGQTHDLQSEEAQNMIRTQIDQVMELITTYWQE
ncbi:YpiF family protein [Pontibacillus marinus]|uniref:DUF2487 domain-containing protein n=1 Tax=Pontibacillus marinus BH030004 = DSM 16465 TaxID=1385511 RepID=A0A0A5HKD8_9BACI|nr:YpiF family protein [Pontibacillus marinus]KGX84087.1 hypothetical protein N783_19125 [Pontibacillus marinus BH030004 = DSM 16465]